MGVENQIEGSYHNMQVDARLLVLIPCVDDLYLGRVDTVFAIHESLERGP